MKINSTSQFSKTQYKLAKATLAPAKIGITVVGEVKQPGEKMVFSGISLIEAIMIAGGPVDWQANRQNIQLIREDEYGAINVSRYKYNINKKNSINNNPILKDGDIINVNAVNYTKFSRGVKNKKTWAQTFNLGYEVRGNTRKPKRRTPMSDAQFKRAVASNVIVQYRTEATRCNVCNGYGRVPSTHFLTNQLVRVFEELTYDKKKENIHIVCSSHLGLLLEQNSTSKIFEKRKGSIIVDNELKELDFIICKQSEVILTNLESEINPDKLINLTKINKKLKNNANDYRIKKFRNCTSEKPYCVCEINAILRESGLIDASTLIEI